MSTSTSIGTSAAGRGSRGGSAHQEAASALRDAALDFVAGLVIPDGRRWGAVAVDAQWDAMRRWLAVSSPTPFSYDTRSRGFSKTEDRSAFHLASMAAQLPPESRSFWIAADSDQGRLCIDAIRGFVARTPALQGLFTIDRNRVTYRRTGSTLAVLPADEPGSWGIRPSDVTFDELAWWSEGEIPRRLFESVSSSAAKSDTSRIGIITTPSDPSHWSHRVLEHARSDPLWSVAEVTGIAPWIDDARVAEQKRRLPASAYARLFLGEWMSAEDRLATADDIRACVTLDGPQDPVAGRRYVIAVDVGLRRDRTVIAVCHLEDGVVSLDLMKVLAGTKQSEVALATVEDLVTEAHRIYPRAQVVVDPWQAIGSVQRLRRLGIPVREFTFSAQSVGRLALTLFTAIRDHKLAIPDDAKLIDELGSVKLRESSPGVYRMDHDANKHDDRAVALGLCAVKLLERGESHAVPGGLAAANAGQTRGGGNPRLYGASTRQRSSLQRALDG